MSQPSTALQPRPILYITYDGLTDPLGRSQVLPYLVGCARRGHRIHIVSAEKPNRFARDRETVEAICRDAGITWHPQRYHKAPPVLSSIYDLAQMRRAALRLHRHHGFGLVHCRSYMPAAAGLALKRHAGVPLVFDMRAFWPDERVEGGSWNLANPLFRGVYRYFKRLESELLRTSDAIVSLTEVGKVELLQRPELAGREHVISVIPCCVDFGHFTAAEPAIRNARRAELRIAPDAPVLTYLGSLGGNYMLPEMLGFFRVFRERRPGARFLFVSLEDSAKIRGEAARHGIPGEELVVRAASRHEVPALLAASDLGVAFKKPSFSAKECSPTKLGEMLAVGLPVVANAGVGDVAEILTATRSGAVIESFDDESYRRALDTIDRNSISPAERRARAQRLFDVELGIERYHRIYRSLGVRPQETNGQKR